VGTEVKKIIGRKSRELELLKIPNLKTWNF
jgi:hypothetical protein